MNASKSPWFQRSRLKDNRLATKLYLEATECGLRADARVKWRTFAVQEDAGTTAQADKRRINRPQTAHAQKCFGSFFAKKNRFITRLCQHLQ